MIPTATIIHCTDHRLRFRIMDRKSRTPSDASHLETALRQELRYSRIRVSPLTGTVVLVDQDLDLQAVARFGRKQKLFALHPHGSFPKKDVFDLVAGVVGRMNSGLRRITANRMDIKGTVFVLLIFHAARELALGRLRTPSWFTALWVASTLYNRRNNSNFQSTAAETGEGPWTPDLDGEDGLE
ncbi:MAG: hypothetical protein R6V54_01050 [Desulfobacteraceae bacterium]